MIKSIISSPYKLFLVVVGVGLAIHFVNIALNSLGVDLGPLTVVSDFIVNLGNNVVWIVGAVVVVIYFYNRFKK